MIVLCMSWGGGGGGEREREKVHMCIDTCTCVHVPLQSCFHHFQTSGFTYKNNSQ